MIYPVTEIFHSLQGEGHFVGYPMTFVRLAGCSVTDCHIRAECDERPWQVNSRMNEYEIVSTVARRGSGIVCITGGEPSDQDLVPLLCGLRDAGYRVHVETSGIRSLDGLPIDWLTVSPKSAQYKQRQGHTLKIVVRPEWGDPAEAWGHVAGLDSDTNFLHRYLQPLTGANGLPVNLSQVTDMLIGPHRNAGARWALSTQAHRNWGIE